MIQLRQDVVWVCDADGKRTPFDVMRLAASLNAAMHAAGITDPAMAEDLAKTAYTFTIENCDDQTIAAAEIVKLIVEVLPTIGLAAVAQMYLQRGHRLEIQLDRLMDDAGFELSFYRQLDHKLEIVGSRELQRVHLHGLRACVMRLRGVRRWNEGCRALADDIVGFVRQRVQQVGRAEPLHLEVTE